MSEVIHDTAKPSMWQRSTIRRMFAWQFSRRILRREAIGLAWIISLLALYYGITDWMARRDWNAFRQKYEAQVGSLEFQSYIPKAVPDSENFAATPFARSWMNKDDTNIIYSHDALSKAFPMLANAPRNQPNRRMTDLVAWQEAFAVVRVNGNAPKEGFRTDQLDLASRAAAAPDVLAGMADDSAVLEELRQASARPDSRFEVEYKPDNPWTILLPHLMRVKETCQRLNLRACAELAEGKSGDALQDVKLELYMADTMDREPFIISYLVHIACLQSGVQPVWEGLAGHRWTSSELEELQSRLSQYNLFEALQKPLHAECAMGAYVVEAINKRGLGFLAQLGNTEGGASDNQVAMDFVGHIIPSGWYDQERIHYCQRYEDEFQGAMDIASKEVFPRHVAANALAQDNLRTTPWQAIRRHEVLARMMLPALERLPVKAAIAQTTVDQAAVACALERYRLSKGQFPESLQLLVPDFIKEVPNDVIGGKPLKYRRSDDGQFVLYSIGWNEKDDGGVPGKSLFDETNGDWVWQYPH